MTETTSVLCAVAPGGGQSLGKTGSSQLRYRKSVTLLTAAAEAAAVLKLEDFSAQLEDLHNRVHIWVGGTMSAIPVAAFDLQGIRECLAENVVQHYVAPSHLTDDGSQPGRLEPRRYRAASRETLRAAVSFEADKHRSAGGIARSGHLWS